MLEMRVFLQLASKEEQTLWLKILFQPPVWIQSSPTQLKCAENWIVRSHLSLLSTPTMDFLSHRQPELDQSNLSPVQLSSNFLSSYLDLFPFHVDISAHKRHKLNWPNWALSTFPNSHLSWASPLSALNLISLLFSSSRIQPCTLHRSVLSSAPPPPSSSTSSFSRWTSSTSSS